MNTLFINTEQIKSIYNTLSHYKTKNKLDMIIEPLQSMIQLALVGTCPIGTKLAIQENIVYLQIPCFTQPFSRWYYSDKKDDLYFLFQVIKRFIKWYNPDKTKSPLSKELYQLIVTMSIQGLDNLIKTYNNAESNNIIQVIYMYKSLLESDGKLDHIKSPDDKVGIDSVFENIIEIYDSKVIAIIDNLLQLIVSEDNPDVSTRYINGLELIMGKTNNKIRNWIKVNLVF